MKKYLILIIACLVVGGAATLGAVKRITPAEEKTFKTVTHDMPDAEKITQRIKITDGIVSSVDSVSELVTMQVQLENTVKLDYSVTSFDILKKSQDIIFYGDCRYSVDLSFFSEDDIRVEDDRVVLYVDRPVISSIEINEDETKVFDTNNGLLRFGEIAATSLEHSSIRKSVRNEMELCALEYEEAAREMTKTAVKDIVTVFLEAGGFNGYETEVIFKDEEI